VPVLGVVLARLLAARDVSLFLARDQELVLAASSGGRAAGSLRIGLGEGAIGWVARKGITMTERDLALESNLVRAQLAEAGEGLPFQIGSPLIYQGNLLGVLTLGRVGRDLEEAARVARMLSSLGSLVLGNLLLRERILRQAEEDGLTGLLSRQPFLDLLERELSKARRYRRPLAVCHFRIDDFGRYNEVHGHLAGDEVLRILARLFRERVREHDTVARFGGCEFALLCPETGAEQTLALAEKLRRAVEGTAFPASGAAVAGRITVSGGVAAYPDHGTDEAG